MREKVNSLDIRNFSQSIINFCNQSSLPIEVKRLALKEILSQMESETERVLKEIKAQTQERSNADVSEN